MDSSTLAPVVAAAASQITSVKYTLLACYAVLVYDYFLTQNDEVTLMWKNFKNFSLVNLVYFVNRYYAFCVFTLEVIENFSPFDYSKCKHYAPALPLGEGLTFSVLSNMVIGLRVYALYGRNKYMGAGIATYIVAQLGLGLWIYTTPSLLPGPLPPPLNNSDFTIPALHLCFAIASVKLSLFQVASFQFMQTAYDSIAFGLIVFKTFKSAFEVGPQGRDSIRTLIVKHGLVYYVIVFTMNFTWAMMIIFAPLNLKNTFASPTLVLTCISVNRLTLSLKGFSEREANEQLRTRNGVNQLAVEQVLRFQRRLSWVGTSTFEVETRHVEDTLDFANDSFALHSRDTTLGSWTSSATKA